MLNLSDPKDERRQGENVDIAAVTLGTLTRLRKQPRPTGRLRYHRMLPKAPLKWLVEKLNIDSCTIYQLTKKGEYVVNAILRPSKDYAVTSSIHSSYPSPLLLDVRFPKSQWQRRLPFYRLEFHRHPPFSESEKHALNEISKFLGDYLFERILHAHEHACGDSLRSLQRICSKTDRKAGTTSWKYFGKLHKALASHASFLLFVTETEYLIHYYKIPSRGSPSFSRLDDSFPLDERFLRLGREDGVFLWHMRTQDDCLAPLIRSFLPDQDYRWDCLCSATYHEGHLFSMQVFLFRRDFPLFRPLYDDFLKEASLLPGSALEEAYRRRTSATSQKWVE